jgi:hypothetical protein
VKKLPTISGFAKGKKPWQSACSRDFERPIVLSQLIPKMIVVSLCTYTLLIILFLLESYVKT